MISLNATILRITINVNGLNFFKFGFLRVPANHPALHVAFRLCFVMAEGPGWEWASCLSLVVTDLCFMLMQDPDTRHEFSCPFSRSRRVFLISVQLWSFVSHSFPCCSQPLPWSGGEWLTGEFPAYLSVAADPHHARMQAFLEWKKKGATYMIQKELSKNPTTLNLNWKHCYEFTRYLMFPNIFVSSFYWPQMSKNMTDLVAVSILVPRLWSSNTTS